MHSKHESIFALDAASDVFRHLESMFCLIIVIIMNMYVCVCACEQMSLGLIITDIVLCNRIVCGHSIRDSVAERDAKEL